MLIQDSRKNWDKWFLLSTVDDERPSSEWDKQYALPGLSHILQCAHRAQWKTEKPISECKERHLVVEKLEKAAERGDEIAFLNALPEFSWAHCSAADVIKVIRLALRSGAHGAMRRITSKGMEYHPDDPDVQRYARLYGPIRRIQTHGGIRDLNHMANKTWLAAHMGEYKDQWIAVRDGVLLGSAPTLHELREKVVDTKRALVTVGF